MFYGNSSITTDQSNPTAVWDVNFKGVWHLPNGTILSANDSTSNGNNGTINGATATTGEIAGGASFNGSNDDRRGSRFQYRPLRRLDRCQILQPKLPLHLL
jgi:hypothetical protein